MYGNIKLARFSHCLLMINALYWLQNYTDFNIAICRETVQVGK